MPGNAYAHRGAQLSTAIAVFLVSIPNCLHQGGTVAPVIGYWALKVAYESLNRIPHIFPVTNVRQALLGNSLSYAHPNQNSTKETKSQVDAISVHREK